MATPMTSSQITSQMNKWKINWAAYKSDWATHNRNHVGAWGGVNGFIIHHVGSDGDARSDLYYGNDDLPGPKCQFYVDDDGKVWMIGWGRANHAGGGDPNVYNHVVAEDYTGTLVPHYHEGSSGAKDGNQVFYGVEIGYSGTHPMTDDQYNTVCKLAACILDFHDWSELSCIAHGEWSDWKWDPGTSGSDMMYMPDFRKDIKATLNAGPGGTTDPDPDDPDVDEPDPDNATYKAVWHTDRATPPKGHETPENPTWHQDSIQRFGAEQAEAANKGVKKLLEHFGLD